MESLKLGDVFSSYEEFDEKWKEYCSTSPYIFSRVSSKSVDSKNKTIKDPGKHYPQHWKFISLVLGCKQFGQYASRCKQQKELRTYKTGCTAVLKLSANKEKNGLVITEVNLEHNHNKFDHKYPEERRLTPEQEQEMFSLLELNVPVRNVKQHFQDKYGVPITERDIRNKKSSSSGTRDSLLTEEQRLWDSLNELSGTAGLNTTLIKDSDGQLSVIFMQTPVMKATWAKYPETLFLDSTYKVNARNMPLFVFVVCDGDNKGQVVAYALMQKYLGSFSHYRKENTI